MNGSKRIYGFWHVAAIGRWRTIVDSQLAKITASGLYDASHAIFVHVVGADGPADIPSALRTGKFTASWGPDLEQFEYSTLQILQQRARQEDFCAWYVHVKGASSSSGEPNCPVLRWREYMDYFVLENWRTCAACLPDHDTVGVEWRQVPRLHYSGNFWWANAAYLRRLPPVEELQRATQGNRFFAEFWLGFGSPESAERHGPQAGTCKVNQGGAKDSGED